MFPENTNAVNSKIDNIDKIKGRQQLNNKIKKKKKKKKRKSSNENEEQNCSAS